MPKIFKSQNGTTYTVGVEGDPASLRRGMSPQRAQEYYMELQIKHAPPPVEPPDPDAPVTGVVDGLVDLGDGTVVNPEGAVDATAGAQELADAEGVDLVEVEGTGNDGRITKGDVEKFLESRSE